MRRLHRRVREQRVVVRAHARFGRVVRRGPVVHPLRDLRHVRRRVARVRDHPGEIRVRSGRRALGLRGRDRGHELRREERSVRRVMIRLDARHVVGRRRMPEGLETVRDAPDAEAEIEIAADVDGIAVRQFVVRGIVVERDADLIRVRRRDEALRRVLHVRHVRLFEIAGPLGAAVAREDEHRERALVLRRVPRHRAGRALRDARLRSVEDVALIVRADPVLRADSEIAQRGAHVIDALRALEVVDRGHLLRRIEPGPAVRQRALHRIRRDHRVVHDRRDDRAVVRDDEHVVLDRRAPLHGDRLVDLLERDLLAVERDRGAVARERLFVDVGDVVARDRRAPRDVLVLAQDYDGDAGEGEARDFEISRGVLSGRRVHREVDHPKHRRSGERQVRIVRHESRDRPRSCPDRRPSCSSRASRDRRRRGRLRAARRASRARCRSAREGGSCAASPSAASAARRGSSARATCRSGIRPARRASDRAARSGACPARGRRASEPPDRSTWRRTWSARRRGTVGGRCRCPRRTRAPPTAGVRSRASRRTSTA